MASAHNAPLVNSSLVRLQQLHALTVHQERFRLQKEPLRLVHVSPALLECFQYLLLDLSRARIALLAPEGWQLGPHPLPTARTALQAQLQLLDLHHAPLALLEHPGVQPEL